MPSLGFHEWPARDHADLSRSELTKQMGMGPKLSVLTAWFSPTLKCALGELFREQQAVGAWEPPLLV